MATKLAALLTIVATADLASDPAADPGGTGTVRQTVENNTNGRRWTQGTASGQADRVYKKLGSLAGSGSDSFNLLAAGSLTDILGQSIDADELKAIAVKCKTGEITFKATATNGISLFTAASEGLKLSAGQMVGVDLGDAGIDVTTNAQFEIAEAGSPAAAATYEVWALVAQ